MTKVDTCKRKKGNDGLLDRQIFRLHSDPLDPSDLQALPLESGVPRTGLVDRSDFETVRVGVDEEVDRQVIREEGEEAAGRMVRVAFALRTPEGQD